jgi:rubredoxin
MKNEPVNADEGDRVSQACACPLCGEARVDYLVWIDDDFVRCQICQTTYDPNWRYRQLAE